MNGKSKHHKKLGSSIEEVMVKRKFDRTDPISWPDGIKFNQPQLSKNKLPGMDRTSGKTRENIKKASKYSDGDLVNMLDSLSSYCRSLQQRVNELEAANMIANEALAATNNRLPLHRTKLQNHPNIDSHNSTGQQPQFHNLPMNFTSTGTPMNLENHNFTTTKSIVGLKKSASAGGSTINLHHQQQSPPKSANLHSRPSTGLGDIIAGIDNKVLNLKEIFRQGDPLDERKHAATLMQACVRGFLARSRMFHYRKAQCNWRWIRCKPVIYLLDILLAKQSKLDAGFHLLKMNRTMKKLYLFFGKWAIVSRQNAQMRWAMREAAEELIEEKRLKLLKVVFEGLRAASVGNLSTRRANADRRKLIESIRLELSEKLLANGHLGVVPEEDVNQVLYRRVLLEFFQKRKLLKMRTVFNGFFSCVKMTRKNDKKAMDFMFKNLVGRCFIAWSEITYLEALGLDRKRWPGPRKYEVRYNQKRVDNFARLRCERFIFSAWKAYFSVQLAVKRRFQRKLAHLVFIVFHGWKNEAKSQHKLRQMTYENWKGYSRLMVYNPFNAWAAHTRSIKNHEHEQMRIARSYLRWKWRQKLLIIMKVWRHQALFGRIDGLYTRQMLLKTLGEQKMLANSLQKLMAEQTTELEDCKNLVLAEAEKRQMAEDQLTAAATEYNTLKMVNHHYEQELRRLQSIVDALIQINPTHVAHLEKMHPNFMFKVRRIALPKEEEGEEREAPSEGVTSEEAMAEAAEALAAVTKSAVESNNTDSKDPQNNNSLNIADAFQPGGEDISADLFSPFPSAATPTRGKKDKKAGEGLESSLAASSDVINGDELLGLDLDSNSLMAGSVNTAVSTPSRPKTRADKSSGRGNTNLTMEQRGLLQRAGWIVERFRDAKKDEEKKAHTVQSLNLVDYDSMADFVKDEDEFEEEDENNRKLLPLRNRPNLLPSSDVFEKKNENFTLQNDQESFSTKALIALIEFLESGDIKHFTTFDKKAWSRHLVSLSAPVKNSPKGRSLDMNNNSLSASLDVVEDSVATQLVTADDQLTGIASWRDAIMQLRTSYPTKERVPAPDQGVDAIAVIDEQGMFNRLLNMRKNINEVTDWQAEKHRTPMKEILKSNSSLQQNSAESLYMDSLSSGSIYANNLSNFQKM